MKMKTDITFLGALVAAVLLDVAPVRCGDDPSTPHPTIPFDSGADDAGGQAEETDTI